VAGESGIWEILGIARTDDSAEIRRAYARRLKAIDPESQAEAFIALRSARDMALAIAAGLAVEEEAEPDEAGGDEPPPEARAEPRPPGRDRASEGVAAGLEAPPIDLARLDRIDALLFGEEAPADPDELAELTRALLADPAAERIETAGWLEDWMADRIVRGTPRSDPMIEPAVAHFRWDMQRGEIGRSPAIDWIAQRREDRPFEEELRGTVAGYDKLLEELKGPYGLPDAMTAWLWGPRVEYLFAYLRARHPTVLLGIDPKRVAWWDREIARQVETGRLRAWREWRRLKVWDQGIFGAPRRVGGALAIGLILYPYIAAWFLLRRGHSREARILGFGWMVLLLLLVSIPMASPPPPPPRADGIPARVAPGPPPDPSYQTAPQDLDPVISFLSDGRIDQPMLASADPGLDNLLRVRWGEAAMAREPAAVFQDRVGFTLQQAFIQGVRHGSFAVQLDYWQLLGDSLRWGRGRSVELCDALADPGRAYKVPLPAGLNRRLWDLEAKVLLHAADPDPQSDYYGYSYAEEEVMDSAAHRAGLPRAAFNDALKGGTTAQERCNARIALLETIFERPDSDLDGLLRVQTRDLYVREKR
jgi:hypothetical protein